jgi:DNA-binding XRE family transcriptional regulator
MPTPGGDQRTGQILVAPGQRVPRNEWGFPKCPIHRGDVLSIWRDRGSTLADLAATTGVSESTLSRLESGQRRATLELLLPLARTYDVPLDDLVGAPRTGDPRIHLKPIRRFGMTFVALFRRQGGVHASR